MEFPVAHGGVELAPALAAGNTCVLKPAQTTPLTALPLAQVRQQGAGAGLVKSLPARGHRRGAAAHPA